MYRTLAAILVAGSVAVAVPLADVWDVAGDNDDGTGTDNELVHGTTQIHDLGVRPGPTADLDYFRIGQKPQTSWEVVVDSTTGDIGFSTTLLQLMASDGTTTAVNGVSTTPGLDYSRSLRFRNLTSAAVDTQFVRVGPGGCGTGCDGNDVYHIRARETTISIARFNNAGSQVTVLVTQNVTDVPINATFFYWSTTGTLLQTGSLTPINPKSLNVFATTGFGTLVGQGGHITIAHDGPHGGLNVKTVALEPSTGFSFDTPGVYKPY